MSVTACPICRSTLPPKRAVYCSRACQALGQRRPRRACLECGQALTRKQIRDGCRRCSRACVDSSRSVIRGAVLDLLRSNTHSWMTVSDLAIWTYGWDDATECTSIRTALCRLRQEGFVIASRRAPWASLGGPTRAYRLAREPLPVVRRVA